MVVPALRFPEFRDAEGWEETSLAKHYRLQGGYAFKSNEFIDNGIPIIRISNIPIIGDAIDLSNCVYYYTINNEENFVVCNGDLLIAMSGATTGKTAIYKKEQKAYLNQRVGLFKSLVGNDYYPFLCQWVNSSQFSYQLNKILAAGAQPNISSKDIELMYFITPKDKDEQIKIAECLGSLDDLISAVVDKVEALKEYKKGLMQQLFPAEGKTIPALRFPEFQNAGEWQETTLVKLAKFRRGSFPQPYGLPEWFDENGMPFIQVYDVDDNMLLKPQTKSKISELAAKQSVFIPKETVIITIQGSIGRVAITQYEAYIDRTLLLFEEFYKPLNKVFFAYILQLLFDIEKQKAPGGIIKTITKEVLSDFKVNMPNIDEQQKIADCLSSIDKLISAETDKLDQLKSQKKGLMQQLFPKIDSE